jgi:hypothetical protein
MIQNLRYCPAASPASTAARITSSRTKSVAATPSTANRKHHHHAMRARQLMGFPAICKSTFAKLKYPDNRSAGIFRNTEQFIEHQ